MTRPTNPGTVNGVLNISARSDHSHDGRYLRSVNIDSSDNTQTVGTPLKFNKTITNSSETFKADQSGNITANIINATKVYNAVYNDYAELYRKSIPGLIIDPGTVISCTDSVAMTYAPSNSQTVNQVVGICSDSYGYLLGGDLGETLENNLLNYIPVALSGRVKVKIVPHVRVRKGDLLVASKEEVGCAEPIRGIRKLLSKGRIIGKSLENSEGYKDTILVQVFLG